ncbi:ABC transporter permease [Candidatus Woesearchaeota archaeon]|jgi:putative ABC transport system permease protein|nr:ABC transporter permease [Candidatus Woesearchaeota archaeon]MBT3438593.1 ABC transporter permease [Candidatus Woesearchaeota archaeon]MBT4058509.1 ABC transporter permease [Candidatus Woesearchaeota archaeon]MBT5042706.1 ABC transporter permease [Candidatus Woesearchaeota archaeon]MBT5112173.1 ABC transporter permease [Candidatus Woesearchaeota archaeon]
MIKDNLRVVHSSLKRRKLRSWLTLVGILIGITAVITLISLGEGIRGAVTSQFDFLNPEVLTIRADGITMAPPGTGVSNPLQEKYLKDIQKIKGVDLAIGRIIENAQIKFNGRSHFSIAISFPKNGDKDIIKKIVQLEIEKGNMLDSSDTYRIVVGSDYSKSDMFGKAVELRDELEIEGKKFKVKGILEKKGSFIVDHSVIINEDPLKDLYNHEDTYELIVVKVESESEIAQVKERLEKYLRKERDVDEGEEDFTVSSPEETLKSLDSTLFGIQLFIYLIAAISILVGGIGIANTMYTSVLERTRDIGVMKAIGAKDSQITVLFLLESGLLGLVGGIVGIIFGASTSIILAKIGNKFLSEGLIQINLPLEFILATLIFSFLVGLISGIVPAIKASKLKPIDALRYRR